MEKHGPFEAPLKAFARGTPSEVGASARLPAQTLAVGGADNGVWHENDRKCHEMFI